MDLIRFEPVSEKNLSEFVRITRETLWHPVWPGDELVAHDFRRWPSELQQAAQLIYRQDELVGRVIAPQFDDFYIIRDLGLREQPGLAQQVAQALLRRAQRRHARIVRAIVFQPWWPALAALGFAENKRRITMQKKLERFSKITGRDVRKVERADIEEVGELMSAAYQGTIDDEGEDVEQWTGHTRDVIEGQYGKFLSGASFVTPSSPPFNSATLLIENAPHCAILAQVVTRRTQTNRGYARRLVNLSLNALAGQNYERCFLEVTLGNANAIHLYHSLGFVEIGPQIVYGAKTLPST